MLLLEITVTGTPVSHQTHNKELLREWQEMVRQAARTARGGEPPAGQRRLQITMIYFSSGRPVRMDNDNMIKPIQDALNGVAYGDDSQISDTIVRRVELTAALRFDGSPFLIAAAAQGADFIYVRLETAPLHEVLP